MEIFIEVDVDIALVFNEFFSGIALQLSNAIDHREPVALDDVEFSMAFKLVTSGEVGEILNSLRANTSCGVDDTPTVVNKILGNILSGPLVNLINKHIRPVTFPAEFEMSHTKMEAKIVLTIIGRFLCFHLSAKFSSAF